MNAREVARWAVIVGGNRLVNPDPHTWKNTGNGGYIHGGPAFATEPGKIADRLEDLAEMKFAPAPRCPLFVELCAGTAALSLRLQGGPHARPPVSRMGAKTGYAEALLWILGLRSGQGADAYLWCEPDDGARAMLQAYPQPDVLREAAEIIRGWADEEPRPLWERLKAEGPIRGADGGEVARWASLNYLSHRSDPGRGFRPSAGGAWPDTPPDVRTIADRLEAQRTDWPPVTITADAREIEPSKMLPQPAVAYRADGASCHAILCGECYPAQRGGPNIKDGRLGELCPAISLPTLDRSVGDLVSNVRLLSAPCEVCGRIVVATAVEVPDVETWRARAMERGADQGSYASMESPASGAHDELAVAVLVAPTLQRAARVDGSDFPSGRNFILGRFGNGSPFDHGAILPCKGAVVYIDPSYVGTTGYQDNLSRDEVIALAQRWSDAGAIVAISEAERVPVPGFDWTVDITDCRKGQKRTFSKQQREIVTLNREPAWTPAEQVDMFGADIVDTGRGKVAR